MDDLPFLSVIIPAYNAREHLGQCLDAVLKSSYTSYEIIVVDDASTDNTAQIALDKGVILLKRSQRSGPAAARNDAALRARGDILFFVDADVLVTRETVALVAKQFIDHPELDALFGSYDINPLESNFISQYKNLFHHFVHQQSREEAVTFWAGCGAIRKEVFQKTAGFDQERYKRPSIEDIELGYRLKNMGHKILLDKAIQVKHLKKWKLSTLLRTDILDRAVPWTRLMLENNEIVRDLNLQLGSKISSGLVGLLFLMLLLAPYRNEFLYGALLVVALLGVLNRHFYKFMFQKGGLGFAVLSFLMHLFYYFYSGLTFVLCWAEHFLFGKQQTRL
jgi:glycosyltransferase involved in cell wall biosynthesis